ncbi:MAG: S8 family serine peptidase, partial [Calditrichaeota bacterium]|nr:S8 family serine peptidase [Calditrichota bacterium]
YGVDGSGVIIAILDRGIDYEHPDFINPDGSTRILYIYDMLDDTGANDPNNPYGIGTIYPQADIDGALLSGVRLATRDAVGHGTATAGL